MALLISLFFFVTVACVVTLIMNIFFREKIIIGDRMKKFITSNDKEAGGLEGSLYERLFQPLFEGVNGYISKVTPKQYVIELEHKLKEAGNPGGMDAGKWIMMQSGAIIIEIIGIISIWIAFRISVLKIMLTMAVLVAFTYLLPKLYLKQMIQDRQKEIEKSLPDVIDLLTVSIEAGLSFDGAMAKLVEKMSGVLVSEFAVVLKEMRMGVSKRDALKSMIERVPVANLITFVGAILQADQLGVSVGNVLRIQSNIMRQKRRQRASELAMKAPIKMLFPMIFFILPTIFIVLLGPVVLKVIEAFSQ